MGPPAIAPQGPTKPTRERLAGRSRARLEGWIGRAPARGWLGVDRDSWESPIEPALSSQVMRPRSSSTAGSSSVPITNASRYTALARLIPNRLSIREVPTRTTRIRRS